MSGVDVLMISGSLRSASTNTAALLTLRSLAREGLTATLYDGLADLPHFNPDDDVTPLHPAVAHLRARIRSADALLFSTPEYAGALPGSFKNLLDWTIGDDAPGSIYEKPVAWIEVSPRPASGAHDSLRRVLGFAGSRIVETACRRIPLVKAMIGPDGLVTDPDARRQLADALEALASGAVSASRQVPANEPAPHEG